MDEILSSYRLIGFASKYKTIDYVYGKTNYSMSTWNAIHHQKYIHYECDIDARLCHTNSHEDCTLRQGF